MHARSRVIVRTITGDTTLFIVLAGAIAIITAIVLILPFLRARSGVSRAAYDAQAYRAQLQELDQDLARGILNETEAKAAKIEVSRRLLAATDAAEVDGALQTTPGGVRMGVAIMAALGAPALAIFVYLAIGEAGRPDMPLASRSDIGFQMAQRPSQVQAEALLDENNLAPKVTEPNTPEAKQYVASIAELEAFLAKNPDDLKGRRLLAGATANLGRYSDSWRHYATLIEAGGEPDTELYGGMIQMMILAANGYVSPEAEAATDAARNLDKANPLFIHYKALALAQRGETKAAYAFWKALLDNADASAPWIPTVHRHATQAAQELGLEPPASPAPTPAPGPSRGDIEAAGEMSEDDRRTMIEGMVAGLAERLAEDPNDLDGWLRLIRAYGVMGRTDDRTSALEMARKTFADDAPALDRLNKAAE